MASAPSRSLPLHAERSEERVDTLHQVAKDGVIDCYFYHIHLQTSAALWIHWEAVRKHTDSIRDAYERSEAVRFREASANRRHRWDESSAPREVVARD